jgi:hypothetical protein
MAGRGYDLGIGAHHAYFTEAERKPPGNNFLNLIGELCRCQLPTAIVSSEKFCSLYDSGDVMRQLAAIARAIASVGYTTTFVFYVREQSGFIESSYAELVKHGCGWNFDDYLERTIASGRIDFRVNEQLALEYTLLATAFEAAFGAGSVLIRPYPPPNGKGMLADFLDAIGIACDARDVSAHEGADKTNARQSCADVLRALHRNAGTNAAGVAPLEAMWTSFDTAERAASEEPFAPLSPDDVARIASRFAAANERLRADYGYAPGPAPHRSATGTANRQRALLRRAAILWNLHPAIRYEA